MRPWEREQETPPPEDSPPRRLTRGSLSSMVVRLPENEIEVQRDDGGGGEVENAKERQLEKIKDLDEYPISPKTRFGQSQRLADGSGFSLPTKKEFYKEQSRGRNASERFADYSPKQDHARSPVNPREFPPRHEHNRTGGRFGMNPIASGNGAPGIMFGNYGRERNTRRLHNFSDNCRQGGSRERFRDISPLYKHKRNWRTFHDDPPPLKRERLCGRPHDLLPSFERERSGGKIHNFSLSYGSESNAQFLERDFKRPSSRILPSKDAAPNIGDWFCEKLLCGKLNFARREYCYHCHSHRRSRHDNKLRSARGSSLEKFSPPVDQWRRKITHRPSPHTSTRTHRPDFSILGNGQSLPETSSQRGRSNRVDYITYRGNIKFNTLTRTDRPDFPIIGNGQSLPETPSQRGPANRDDDIRYDFGHERKGAYREFWERSRSPRRDQHRPLIGYTGGLFRGRGQGDGQDWPGRRRGALVGDTP